MHKIVTLSSTISPQMVALLYSMLEPNLTGKAKEETVIGSVCLLICLSIYYSTDNFTLALFISFALKGDFNKFYSEMRSKEKATYISDAYSKLI